jgi:hypothetical protein
MRCPDLLKLVGHDQADTGSIAAKLRPPMKSQAPAVFRVGARDRLAHHSATANE